jgi:hypothetical protein
MTKFLNWLGKRDETFRVIPSDVGDDRQSPPIETPGAFPYYSDDEKPPTFKNKITSPKKNCNCKK